MSRNFLTFAKLLFGLGFVLILYQDLDWEQLSVVLNQLNYSIIILFCFLYFTSQVVSALKWSVLLSALGIRCSFRKVVESYFLGMFVNCFALGTVGGDASRAISLSNSVRSKKSASLFNKQIVSSVVFDRFHGLVILLGIGVVSLAIKNGFLAKLLATLTLLFFLCLFLRSKIEAKNSSSGRFLAALCRIRVLLKASLLSVISHMLQIAMFYVLLRVYKENISSLYLLSTVPFINAGSALPFSVNGLGIRDWLLSIYYPVDYLPLEVRASIGSVWIFCTGVVAALVAFFLTLGRDFKTIAQVVSRSVEVPCSSVAPAVSFDDLDQFRRVQNGEES